MKLTKGLLSLALLFSVGSVSFLSFPFNKVIAQEGDAALMHGYRTGYSDGYMAGYRDTLDKAAKNYSDRDEYKDATRAYSQDFGSVEDYRDGYRQGFESGYSSGYEKRSFDSTLPSNLTRRAAADTSSPNPLPLVRLRPREAPRQQPPGSSHAHPFAEALPPADAGSPGPAARSRRRF